MAKQIIIISIFLLTSFTLYSQNWNNYGDTIDVINILNGHWKLKHQWGKYDIYFNFSENEITYSDYSNLWWYDKTPIEYSLEWSDNNERIFLKIKPINNPEDFEWREEIWIIDNRTIYLYVGGDFGIYEMNKKKK